MYQPGFRYNLLAMHLLTTRLTLLFGTLLAILFQLVNAAPAPGVADPATQQEASTAETQPENVAPDA